MKSTRGIGQATKLLGSTVKTLQRLRNDPLSLGEGIRTCAGCGAHHDRDVNAALNLQRLSTGAHAAHEYGQQDGSGQEEIGEHLCTPSW